MARGRREDEDVAVVVVVAAMVDSTNNSEDVEANVDVEFDVAGDADAVLTVDGEDTLEELLACVSFRGSMVELRGANRLVPCAC